MTHFRFVLVRDREVVRECVAADLATARTILRPGPDAYVTSRLSHDVGLPTPIRAGLCLSCGQRPRLGPKTPRCAVCEPRVHESHQRTSVARRAS